LLDEFPQLHFGNQHAPFPKYVKAEVAPIPQISDSAFAHAKRIGNLLLGQEPLPVHFDHLNPPQPLA